VSDAAIPATGATRSVAKILVVDDVAMNVKLLADLLGAKGYATCAASSGAEALARLVSDQPDLVLLDVMMPGMSGYEVCAAIRADPAHAMLPVVLVTALDPAEERARGLDAGADDFLSKPVSQAELLARVRSLLRIKSLYDEVRRRELELAELNRTLEARVTQGVQELEKIGRLKRFFSPHLAELIVAGGADDPMRSHRREITVVFLDLRGFTAFTETAEPEEVMGVLGQYHAAVGRLVLEHEGTLERFSGDGIMVFFNDPVPIADPAPRATRMAQAIRAEVRVLAQGWAARGYQLTMGIGIAQGFATIGAIGFPGRIDYGAIGTVTNLAARLCGEAQGDEILISQRVRSLLSSQSITVESAGDLALKGFLRPVPAYRVAS
ncbi:MAG: response regulator, partial [Caldimonas sp.]